MELGVVLWQTDQGVDLREVGRLVEAAGLESLFVVSHSHIPVSRPDVIAEDGHALDAHLLDQFTVLGAIGAVTKALKLGTCACIAPQCDTITLAKQVATLDHLCPGRVVLGVGAGWLVEELRNHGVDAGSRWDKLMEQVLALRRIWTEDEAEFHGELVDFDPIWLWPKPAPPPPVFICGSGQSALRATVECGDGWMPIVGDVAQLQDAMDRLRRACDQVERDVVPTTACMFALDESLVAAAVDLGVQRCAMLAPTDTADALASFLEEYAALGAKLSTA